MEFAQGNIFIRANDLPKKGDLIDGHTHNFDHSTLVVAGSVVIKREHPDGSIDNIGLRTGELPVLIKAECRHTITALEDNTRFFCLYAHRTPQGDVVERFTGWRDAYS